MEMNEDKSLLLVFGSKEDEVSVSTSGSLIQGSDEEKLLGVTLARRLSFNNHVSNLCKKASQKLNALARVSKYMEKSKLELTMTPFVMSHFSYCPLVSMFHDGKSHSKIKKIHERTPRIIYKDSTSNFEELLVKTNPVFPHQRNSRLIASQTCFSHNLKWTELCRVFSLLIFR